MRLSDDLDNEPIKSGISIGAMMLCILIFMSIIIGAVLYVNRDEIVPKKHNNQAEETSVNSDANEDDHSTLSSNKDEYQIGESTLTSDDLDFWDMYKEPDEEPSKPASEIDYTKKLEELEKEEQGEDLSENGTKTEVVLPDGTSQWVMINAYIKKNEYDYLGLVTEDPYLRYYANGKQISKQGILLNDSYGTVNFEKLEKNGVNFAILNVGKRGYSTGEISADTMFSEYANSAKLAGVSIGASFISQAITEDEAREEANYVIQVIRENGIDLKYPIVFDMELISGDTARTDNLTKNQLTLIARAFCEVVRQNGYSAVIYGDKYWLLRKLDLTLLSDMNIFLSQERDVPDYPYEFTLWEYKKEAKLEGVSEKVPMCISFLNYEMR